MIWPSAEAENLSNVTYAGRGGPLSWWYFVELVRHSTQMSLDRCWDRSLERGSTGVCSVCYGSSARSHYSEQWDMRPDSAPFRSRMGFQWCLYQLSWTLMWCEVCPSSTYYRDGLSIIRISRYLSHPVDSDHLKPPCNFWHATKTNLAVPPVLLPVPFRNPFGSFRPPRS